MPAAILGPLDLAVAVIFGLILLFIPVALIEVARQIERLRNAMVETFTDDERSDHAQPDHQAL